MNVTLAYPSDMAMPQDPTQHVATSAEILKSRTDLKSVKKERVQLICQFNMKDALSLPPSIPSRS